MGVEIIVAKNTWSNLMHEARASERISMINPGNAWEISGKYGKSRETPKNPGRSWVIFLVNYKFMDHFEQPCCLMLSETVKFR